MLIKLDDFQILINQANSYSDYLALVRKYLFHGTPFVFNNRESDYYDFRAAIADHWGVRFHEVMILGSAKLGYSYFKKTVFSLDSDIDVSIVSPILFEQFVNAISKVQYKMDKGLIRMTQEEYKTYMKFLKFLVKGWMRPELLPAKMGGIIDQDKWFEYFRSISHGKSSVGNFKIAAGLFKNYDYMERYYVESLKSSKNETNTIKSK